MARKGMTFDEAKTVVIGFGDYEGRTLDQIAESDAGLRYLDWLVDQRSLLAGYPRMAKALEVYLADETIASELERILNQ